MVLTALQRVSTPHENALARQGRYREKHRDELRIKGREYYQLHIERIESYRLAHHESNLLYWREYARNRIVTEEYRLKHLKITRRWKSENKDKISAYNTIYAKEHPLLFIEKSSRRRALIRNTRVEKIDLDAIILRDKQKCGLCGKYVKRSELSFDHIIPLIHGGNHVCNNLQVAHRKCNGSKGTGRIPSQVRLAI